MPAGEAEPIGLLLRAGRGRCGDAGADEGHRSSVHQVSVLWVTSDRGLPAPGWDRGRSPPDQAPDGEDGPGGDLQAAQNQPTASAAPGLSVFTAGHGRRPAEPGLVCRYHLHPGEARLPVSGRDHGLGHAQGAELAAQQYDARGLLRRGT